MSRATKLTVQRMCELAPLSRGGFYRRPSALPPAERDRQLRRQIHKLALPWPSYGSRRIRQELGRQGWRVNRKRVQRHMREQNLLCRPQRKFRLTTDSQHGLAVYPNLAPTLALDGVNQLWVGDLTYIRLDERLLYLALLLDAYSRRVIGGQMGTGLDHTLPLAALRLALAKRRPRPGLVPHSDRGVQYACQAYTQWLEQHQIRISMSRKGNPYDKARCESFFRTLKGEAVDRSEYGGLADAQARIGDFLEQTYNQQRLHSALGYRPPLEFERQLRSSALAAEVGA